MIALVRGVIFFSISAGSIDQSAMEITSASTGTPPETLTELMSAINVKDGTMTSSPVVMPRARTATCNAAVPFDTAKHRDP